MTARRLRPGKCFCCQAKGRHQEGKNQGVSPADVRWYTTIMTLIGVNLGGWLVTERWMTPSLFAGLGAADEYTLSCTAEGQQRIIEHRRKFITERDIIWLKQQGVDLVRVPVGYWLFADSPPYVSGAEPLDNCLCWCQKHGLRLIIDLHGVPGSQNGNDHSGKIGAIEFWDRQEYQTAAIQTLKTIAQRYGQSPVLWGIQLLNEPHVGLHPQRLRQWYRRAYDAIDELLAPEVKVIFSDGFRPRLLSGALGRRRRRAVMDIHHYQFATKYARWSRLSLRLYKRRLGRRRRMIKRLARTQPIMVGEWSAVIGHELLQSEQISATDYRTKFLPWHVQAQRKLFKDVTVTCYWTYKIESTDDIWRPWNFRTMVEQGVLRYDE